MPEQADETLQFPVTRELAFVRFYADNAAALMVGDDVELSFLVSSPSLSLIESQGTLGGNELTLEAAFVELCRVRMTPKAATSAAFNVIFALLSEGKVDPEKVRTNIENMISTAGLPEETNDAN